MYYERSVPPARTVPVYLDLWVVSVKEEEEEGNEKEGG